MKLKQKAKLASTGNSHNDIHSNKHSKDRDFPCLQHSTHTHTHIPMDTHGKRSPLVDTHAVGRRMADLTGLRQTHTQAMVSVTSAS